MIYLVFFFFKHNRLLSFAIVWFLVNLVIESTIIPLEMVFEHRLYIPLAIPVLAVVTLSCSLVSDSRQNVLRAVFIALVILLSIGTWQRNKTWSTSVSLWEDVARKSPNLLRSYEGLSKAYNDRSSFLQTSAVCSVAEEKRLESLYLYNNCGFAALALQKRSEGIRLLESAIRLHDSSKAGNFYQGTKFTDFESLYANLSKAYLDANQLNKSYDICQKAFQQEIVTASVYNACGVTALRLNKTTEGVQLLQRATRIDNSNAATHLNLAMAYEKIGRISEALRERAIARQLMGKSQ